MTRHRHPDLTGRRFGLLTVLRRVANGRNGVARWACQCACGGLEKVVTGSSLLRGQFSCGCATRSRCAASKATHGMSKSPTYRAWLYIRRKKRSGSAEVDPAWDTFACFAQQMGEKPGKGWAMVRMDKDLPFSKENCAWLPRSEADRVRTSRVLVTANGRTRPITHWAQDLGLQVQSIHRRIKSGWSPERAVTTPRLRASRR